MLVEKGPLPRHKLAEEMNLTPTTITNLTYELFKAQQIFEVGYNYNEKIRKGPKSINLDVNSDFFWTIGVHIKYKTLQIACVDLKGRIKDKISISYEADITQDAFITFLQQTIEQYMKAHHDKHIAAIGIGSFGLIDSQKGVLVKVKHFPKWYHLNLQDELEKQIQLPVVVNHHVRAMTLAEKKFNQENTAQNFVVVYIGEGIGAGMFIDGELYQQGGQLAHTNYEANGIKCWCGQQGCIEQYVSEALVLEELNVANVSEIKEKMNQNDREAINVLYEYGTKLGVVIASFLQMIQMEAIMLRGGLFFHHSPMTAGVMDKVKDSMNYYEEEPNFIEGTSDVNNMVLIGATSIVAESDILTANL